MSVDRVREYLKGFGLDSKVKEFEVSSATVELAAEAAGVIPARISGPASSEAAEKSRFPAARTTAAQD